MAAPDLAALRATYSINRSRVLGGQAKADVLALLNYIGEIEETVLGAADLLYPDGDWGPKPPGSGSSYRSYVYECVGEQATEIRDQWKARGWSRA